ncbi:MAG: hypothetical protein U9N49_07755, partial [Campylobacterota bacterium]|nr:hypothetical protein [Campylobacterota bacterium]
KYFDLLTISMKLWQSPLSGLMGLSLWLNSFLGFFVRGVLVGSSLYYTETGSLSYGLIIRLQLLPTLPHGNAVIFSYKVYGLPW